MKIRRPESSEQNKVPVPEKEPSCEIPTVLEPAQTSNPNEFVSVPAGGFPMVGIGASAGGLEALEEFFLHMPADPGIAFIVVTHQHPKHTSLLPDLLNRKTNLPVEVAADGLVVKKDHVYVSPPGCLLAILHGTLHRMEVDPKNSSCLPIDFFFRSLAEDQKERAICVILSGSGTDGTLGLKAVKGESGMVMAEQVQSAKYTGMPSSAISTGLVDYILTPAAMPSELVAYTRRPFIRSIPGQKGDASIVGDESMQKIMVLLRARTGHDFSLYRQTTLRRRIERRMSVHQIDSASLYVRYVQESPQERDILFRELLIGVTAFFRDAEAWKALRPFLVDLVKSRPDRYTFRAWIPGCATGEEVFSVAILLQEIFGENKTLFNQQIFGTDLNAEAIAAARTGCYLSNIGADIELERFKRFFICENGVCRIAKDIREAVIFASHNLIKDPPFSKLDFLSCRNLLIYLSIDLQKMLIPLFHYALKPGGLLFLGPSESLGLCGELFETLDSRWKIFRRREVPAAMNTLPGYLQRVTHNERRMFSSGIPDLKREYSLLPTQIEKYLLNHFTPVSVLVNNVGDIMYIHGRPGVYLEPSQGQPKNNIVEMAREGLQIELASAIRECCTTGADVERKEVRFKSNGGFLMANFSIVKLSEPEQLKGSLLVVFRSEPAQEESANDSRCDENLPSKMHKVDRLERELLSLKDVYRSTFEEWKTANEELKSMNQELQSTNEELQSTNEELETSKEEMQSLNEELTTVNTELQSKLMQLSQANDDMQNLFNSTDIAALFLDNKLNIKRFTEQAKKLAMLRPADIGRPVTDLAWNLEYGSLGVDCRTVLKTLVLKEIEIRSISGVRYLLRIVPYRTTDNVIDGLVLTFVDVDRLLQTIVELENPANVAE